MGAMPAKEICSCTVLRAPPSFSVIVLLRPSRPLLVVLWPVILVLVVVLLVVVSVIVRILIVIILVLVLVLIIGRRGVETVGQELRKAQHVWGVFGLAHPKHAYTQPQAQTRNRWHCVFAWVCEIATQGIP